MIRTETEARVYFANTLQIDDQAFERLELLRRELSAENARQNLVSAASLNDIWVRHFADSAQLLHYAPNTKGRWLDLGSGAGFPGLVLGICRPSQKITLVESRRRRVEWLDRMTDALGLNGCEVVGNRLEVIETFSAVMITARAFAPLGKLIGQAGRFSTPESVWVLPKGRSAKQEVEELSDSHSKMFHVEQSLTSAEAGIVVGKGMAGATA